MSRLAPLLAALAVSQASPELPPDAPPAPAPPPPAAVAPAAEPPRAAPPPAAAPRAAPSSAAPPAAPAAPARRPLARDPAAERAEAERVARAFVAALAASDADGLAAASAERFSFDGRAVAGREAVRRTWGTLLAARAARAPRAGPFQLITVQEAVARLGPPPARLASLAGPDALVALADMGGRQVVLFVARDGARMAVVGMHD
jgi:hypothetical protein